LFQALDLVFFGLLKKLKASATGEFDDDSVKAQVTKLIQAYEQTATSSTIRGSFRKAGYEHDTATRPFKLRVVQERLRENPGFQEMWGATCRSGRCRRGDRLSNLESSIRSSCQGEQPYKPIRFRICDLVVGKS
jgi:hypothetical protein